MGKELQVMMTYLQKTSFIRIIFHTMIIVLLCLSISLSYVIAFHFSTLLSVYKESKSSHSVEIQLRETILLGKEIEGKLKSLLKETSSVRTYVYRYHNGTSSVENFPFFFQSQVYEVVLPPTLRILPTEQRLPVGIYPSANAEFALNNCVVDVDLQNESSVLHYIYYSHKGIKSIIQCPIFTQPNNVLMGYIGADFRDNLTDKVLQNNTRLVRDYASIISQMYQNDKK